MPVYDKRVWEMFLEIKNELPSQFTPKDVIRIIHRRRPQVKANTIRAHMIGCTPNHPSHKYYSMPHDIFRYMSNGKYRLSRAEETMPSKEEIPQEPEVAEESREFSYEFERDLEHHLVENLEAIEPGLKLYVKDKETDGEQFVTDVGKIDVLARDKNGDFVVIEVKGSEATDKAVGQLLRYMGWVKKKLAKQETVRGIIIAKKASDELKYAVSNLENVAIKEYEVQFNFRNVESAK